jgi:uncharacterized membrane protein
MAANQLTAFVLVLVVALVGVYDAWAGLTQGYGATITAVVREASARWSIIPFLAGALAAHLFGW